MRACAAFGMETGFLYRSDDLPTDRYIAVEGANGSGYLRVNALRIGEPVPLHSGLSGALAGN